jgi:peptidoglycan/LPS O-acetylase OafA/YrhL
MEVAAPLRYPPSREAPPRHAPSPGREVPAGHERLPAAQPPSGRQPPPAGPRKPSRSRLPSLTGLRIFGSVAVVLCHVGNGFANAPSLKVAEAYGYVGVSFFFMLSGFVLAWSDTPQTARRFWWLRLARIWPLQFLLMVFAYTAIAGTVRTPGPLGRLAELFLLQAWFPGNSTYAGGNGVTWSLSVEMFFYLVFPLAIVLLRRLRGRGLAVTAAVTLGLMAILPLIVALAGVDPYSNLYYWLFFVFPPYRFGEFLLGMVLARAMVLGLRIPAPARTALVAVAGVAGLTWTMTSFTVRTGIPFVRPLAALLAIPFFAALLCASATRDTQPGSWWLGSAPLRRLGDWSFALYLVHVPAMAFTTRFGWWYNYGGLQGAAYLLAFLALVLALSAALHYLVEKPVERRLRRLPVGQPRTA